MANYDDKVAALRRRLRELESAVVAFSGGVDSSVLTAIASEELGGKMTAATAVSPSLPEDDRALASSFCLERGIKHFFVETDEFDDPAFVSNPEDRCYFCKKHLYDRLTRLADEEGFCFVIEGTNESDLDGHRPGYAASRGNGRVATPLIDAGFTKNDVRRLARELGLSTAEKPSAACLSSRVPTNTRLEPEILKRIDKAENLLRRVGAGQVRVRHHGELARIELDPKDIRVCIEQRHYIYDTLKELGWKFVTLDLLGYRTGGTKG